MPAAGTHVAGGVLHRGINGRENAGECQVSNGEKAHDLHNHQATHAIDVVAGNAQQRLGNEALFTEEEDDGQGKNKGRGQDRQCGDGLEKFFAGHVGAGDGIGEDIADKGGDDGHDDAQQHGPSENSQIAGCGEDRGQVCQREVSVRVRQAEDQDLQ